AGGCAAVECAHPRAGVGLRAFGKADERGAYLDEIALAPVQPRDAARLRGGDFDHRFVSFDRHQWLVDDDIVAFVDVPGDDLRLFETLAQVRQEELAHRGDCENQPKRTHWRAASAMRATEGR